MRWPRRMELGTVQSRRRQFWPECILNGKVWSNMSQIKRSQAHLLVKFRIKDPSWLMFCDVLCTSGSQVLLISWPVTCPILIAGDPSEAEAEIGASLRTWYRWHPLPKEPWCPSIKHGMRKANRPTDETWWEAATKQKRSLAGLLSGVKWSIVKLLRMLEFSCPALGFLPHHQRLSQWTRVWSLTLGSRNVTWRA
jgi:hypothetical protein